MIKLEKIHFETMKEVSPKDVFWLDKAGDKICSAVELVRRALDGETTIWKISGDAEGVIVLTPEGKKLSVDGFAGKGIIKHFKEFYKEVRLLCAVSGFDTLTGHVRRKGIEELYRKNTGAKQVMAIWEERLK